MALIRRAILASLMASLLTLWPQLESGLTSPLHSISTAVLTTRSPVPILTARPVRVPALPPMVIPARRHVVPRLSAATTVLDYPPPPIQARAAILVDMRSGRVLYSKNPDERLPMASTTKIMTAVLALQRSRLSDLVTVSQRAATIGESTMALQRGERVTVLQLLYGLMLNSGNDAAIALAEHVAGTEEAFVRQMNRLARALHMWHTHYVTAHGLDEPNHYSSARDLATITEYAMRDPMFRRIVGTISYYVPPTRHNHAHWLASVNRVMYWYPGVTGVKPGDTDAAGLCQVVTVQRDGKYLLAVLLNTPTLVTDIRNLLDYGLRDFRWVHAPDWWDGPSDSVSGGSGGDRWIYYLGAGHYIRGRFLDYFNTHGGLRTLGYPRTEQIHDDGLLVQYFQGGRLVYDSRHHSVYPDALGQTIARAVRIRTEPGTRFRPAAPFLALYKSLGGRGVLGAPIADMTGMSGYPAQFFQYGELALVDGTPYVVPLGDAALRLRGWLPALGAANVAPPSLNEAVAARVALVHRVAQVATHRRHFRKSTGLNRNGIRDKRRAVKKGKAGSRGHSSSPSR